MLMSLVIKEQINYLDRVANVIITITLVKRPEVEETIKNIPSQEGIQMTSVGEDIESGTTTITIPLLTTGQTMVVRYSDIIEANPNIDLKDAFVHFESELHFDRSQGKPPVYASDMAPIMRAAGVSEEDIQAMLAIEQNHKNNQNPT
jgi:hypothetical protein